jgi:hypothetical protein
MTRKRVLITLPADAYRRLVALAEDEERVIDQQASLLLKRLLADFPAPDAPINAEDRHSPVGGQVGAPTVKADACGADATAGEAIS